MKKYTVRFNFSNNTYNLAIPGLGRNLSNKQRILEIITSLRNAFFLTFLLFIPVSMYFFEYIPNVSLEASLLVFLTIGLLITSLLYFIEAFIAPKYRIIDPNGSFFVLIFGLLISASSAFLVFTNYESSKNTFGNVSDLSIKGVAGLTVITLMSIYYYVSLEKFQRNNNRALTFFSLGLNLFIFFTVLDPSLKTNFLIFVISIPIFIAASANSNSSFIKLVNFSSILICFYNIFTLNVPKNSFILLLATFLITSLIISYLIFSFRLDKVANYLKTYIPTLKIFLNSLIKFKFFSRKNIDNLIKIVLLPTLFSLPITIVLLSLLIISDTGKLEAFNNVLMSYESALKRISESLLTLITGVGASQVSVNYPFVASVLIANGLLGLLGYILVFGFGVYKGIKLLIKEQSSLKNICIVTILLFIPILSLFIYPSLILLVIWWIVFSIILNPKLKNNFKYSPEIKKTGKVREIIKIVVLLTLFIICYILVYTVNNNVGILF